MAVTNDVQIIVSLKDQATAGLGKLSGEISKVGKSTDNLGKSISTGVNKSLTAFAENMKSAGLVAGTLLGAMGLLAKGLVDVGSSYQEARIAFETMLGSAEKAGKLLTQISEFARKTPFQLPEVVEGTKKLLAYGIAAEDIIPTFTNLGNIAAGVGKDKLSQLVLAYGQVRTATFLTGMELRQFTEAGVPLLEQLSKQSGKSAAQIKEDMEAGIRVPFEDVRKALEALSGTGGRFENLMIKLSTTVSGRISNLQDNFTRLKLAFLGITEAGDIVKGGLFDRLSLSLNNLLIKLDEAMPSIQMFFNMLTQNQTVLLSIAGAITGLVILAIGALIVSIAGALPIIAAFAAAGALVAVLWKPISDGIVQLVNNIITFLIPILQQTHSAFISFAEGFRVWASSIVNTVESFVSSITTLFSNLYANVSSCFTNIYSTISTSMSSAYMDASKFANDIWTSISTAFSNALSDATAALSGIVSAVTTKMREAWNEAVKWAAKIREEIRKAFDKSERNSPSIMDTINDTVKSVNLKMQDFNKPEQLAHSPAFTKVGKSVTPSINNSPNISLNVSIGLYAGSATEKRNVASELYKSLVELAQTKNKTVAELLGA
jgi:tape measure domain-containing protein